MSARYTVIGAGGFIGSRVVAALAADGIDALTPARGDESWLDQDLGRVFYCAGLTGDYRQRPFATVEAHVGLLSRVLEAGRFERLVFLSSTRLYGAVGGRESDPLTIDPNDPEHLYELTKALGENLTLHRSAGRGAVARLAYVFDWEPGAEGFLADWLRLAAETREITLDSSPANGRDFIHVDDAVAALRAILDSSSTDVVNIATGEVTTNADLAAAFEAEGWRVTLTGGAAAALPPRIDTAALSKLGVRPRSAVAVVRRRLAQLAGR